MVLEVVMVVGEGGGGGRGVEGWVGVGGGEACHFKQTSKESGSSQTQWLFMRCARRRPRGARG